MRELTYISLFSGIEAATVAWEPLGFRPLAFAEVDEFCCAVLKKHYPNIQNLGNVCDIDWKDVIERHGRPDVVVGGSPCQSFSVAGGRESLAGESRLMFEYIRALAEIRPTWFLWENVPGVLNTRDNAFAQLLREVQDIGYLSLAWRVLDAQFFGVAQRRRRVFLVGHLGTGGGAASVLFESKSVRGNTQTSKQKREELTRAAGRGVAESGSAGFCGYASHTAKSIGYEEETAPTLKGNDWQCQVPDVLQTTAIRVAQTSANGCGIAEELAHTIDTTQPESVAFAQNTRDEVRLQNGDGQVTGPIAASDSAKGQGVPFIAQSNAFVGNYGGNTTLGYTDECSPTMTAKNQVDVICMADHTQNAAIDENMSGTLRVGGGTPLVAYSHPAERT